MKNKPPSTTAINHPTLDIQALARMYDRVLREATPSAIRAIPAPGDAESVEVSDVELAEFCADTRAMGYIIMSLECFGPSRYRVNVRPSLA